MEPTSAFSVVAHVMDRIHTLRDVLAMEITLMINALISLLIFFWIVGFVSHIGGGFIHTLLVLAIAVFIFNVVSGRGARV